MARERFLTEGAQNSKTVSTSGGRSPPDPLFLEFTFLGAGTHSRPVLIGINCMPAQVTGVVSGKFFIMENKIAYYHYIGFSKHFVSTCMSINQSVFWTRLSLGGRGGSSSSWSLQASRSSATTDRCSAGMPRRDQLRSST